MTNEHADHVAAAYYRREAEKDWWAAERARKLGQPKNEKTALELARRHDKIAEILEGGSR